MVVAKAYPDGSRCSYCCGFTFEVFVRAMKLRNIQNGLEPDDFNGMTFNDLFNVLQLWYIEGKGDSEQRAIVSYGLGTAVTNFEDARPGDFLSYSTTPAGGHSVIFVGWLRDDANDTNKITGLKYFSSIFPPMALATAKRISAIAPKTATAYCGKPSSSATSARSKITNRSIASTSRNATLTRPPSLPTSSICRSRQNKQRAKQVNFGFVSVPPWIREKISPANIADNGS
ncbi:MAG: hypothetical protein WDM76_19790 [Limisphaerales bacterium]